MTMTTKRSLPKYFTLDELRIILSDSAKDFDYDSWFLCFILARTGARISELLKVKLSDIDFSAKTIKFETLKREHHVRYVPVKAEVLAAIGERIARRSLYKNDYLFKIARKTAYNRVKKLCEYAGLGDERAHPHTFRHTYAIINLAQGVPVTVVQEWLGHANILNTLIYTRILAQHSKQFAENIQW